MSRPGLIRALALGALLAAAACAALTAIGVD